MRTTKIMAICWSWALFVTGLLTALTGGAAHPPFVAISLLGAIALPIVWFVERLNEP